MISLLSLIATVLVAQQLENTIYQDTIGDQSREQSASVDIPNVMPETRYSIQAPDSDSRNTLVDPDSWEPDNTAAMSKVIYVSSVSQSQNHTIHTTNDQDWYYFMAYDGRAYRFVVTGISVQLALFLSDGVTPAPTSGNYIANQQWEISTSGIYKLKVIGAAGATGSYTITYSYVAAADAYEPDNSAADPGYMIIPLGYEDCLQRSLHTVTDEDWIEFWTCEGGLYTIWSTGNTDVRVYLYRSNGTTLIAQDEDSGEGNNFSLTYTGLADEFCYLRITGNTPYAIGNYTLHSTCNVLPDAYEPDNSINQFTILNVTTDVQTQIHTIHTPTDHDWYRFSAVQGKTYSFYSNSWGELFGAGLYSDDGTLIVYSELSGLNGHDFNIEYTATATEYMWLKVACILEQTGNQGFYDLHYLSWAPADEYEPDNTAAEANTIDISSVQQVQTHTLNSSDDIPDQDWYQFYALQGYTYRFYSTGSTDTQASVYQQDGVTLLGFDDDSGVEAYNFAISFIPTSTAIYKLKVTGYNSATNGTYDIHYWSELEPDAFEPDNSSVQGTTITPTTDWQTQSHTLHDSQDHDWFTFYGRSDMIYTFYSTSNLDTHILLYNEDGTTLLQSSDDEYGYGYNFYMEFVPGTSATYRFYVDAYNDAIGGYQLNYQCSNALTAPSGLHITSAGDQITLSWSVVPNAISYRIEASDNPHTGFTQVGTTTENTWTATADGTKRFYRVIALP